MTGTGKTLIYLLPIFEALSNDPYGIFGLIISPTRELAVHIHQQVLFFGSKMGIKSTLLIGGESYVSQSTDLNQIPHILVATPGKLSEIFENNPTVKKYIKNLRFLVLDEFDRLMDPSLLYFLNPIISKLPEKKQIILTTATFKEEFSKIESLKQTFGFPENYKPKCFNLNKEIKVVESIQNYYIFLPATFKDYYFIYIIQEEYRLLSELLEKSIIIFFNKCEFDN